MESDHPSCVGIELTPEKSRRAAYMKIPMTPEDREISARSRGGAGVTPIFHMLSRGSQVVTN